MPIRHAYSEAINVMDYIPTDQAAFIIANDVPSQNATTVTNEVKAALLDCEAQKKSLFVTHGRYAINSTLDVKVPVIGENQRTTSFYMIAAAPCIDMWGIPSAGPFLKDIGVSYKSLAGYPGTVTTACVAVRLLYNSVVAGDQLTGVSFTNLYLNGVGIGIEYKDSLAGGVGVSTGQLYMVDFENIYVVEPIHRGIVLRSSGNGSLNVNLRRCNVDFFVATRAAGHIGFDLWNIINMSMDNCLVSKAAADNSASSGYVMRLEAIQTMSISNFQFESTEVKGAGANSPITVKGTNDIKMDISMQTPTITSGGVSYGIYLDNLSRNAIVNGFKIWNPTLTSGTLGKLFLNNTSDLTWLSVIDGTVRPAECSIAVPSAKNVFLHP